MQIIPDLPDIPNWILYTALGSVALYIYGSWPYRYWKQRGIDGPKMAPFIEGMLELSKYKDFRVLIMSGVRRFGKVYGSYFMRRPVLLVADPEMAKQICIKRSDNFVDRNTFAMDFPPLEKGILVLKGQEWKRVRALLSPTFSSGKMKAMYPLIDQCAKQLCASLIKVQGQVVDLKKYFTNFTMDAVACTLFGMQINTQENENSEFKRHTEEIFSFNLWSWKFWAVVLFPRIAKPLFRRYRISLWRMETLDFFVSVIGDALREREASADADKYHDFLASMVAARREAESQGVKSLTEEEVMAQSLTFFIGGLETTSTSMQFMAYFLAWNKSCQNRAYREVVEAKERNGGVLTYDCVQSLQYLNQCFDETLRMCPPVLVTDRVCTDTTVVNGYEIEKGIVVQIPIFALAHDPEVWPDPETFNPDRFSPEMAEGRDSAHLIPFGMGARGCIGMRLAQLEIRKAIAEMLLEVEFLPEPGVTPTFDKLEFKLAPVLATKEPIRLRIQPRALLSQSDNR